MAQPWLHPEQHRSPAVERIEHRSTSTRHIRQSRSRTGGTADRSASSRTACAATSTIRPAIARCSSFAWSCSRRTRGSAASSSSWDASALARSCDRYRTAPIASASSARLGVTFGARSPKEDRRLTAAPSLCGCLDSSSVVGAPSCRQGVIGILPGGTQRTWRCRMWRVGRDRPRPASLIASMADALRSLVNSALTMVEGVCSSPVNSCCRSSAASSTELPDPVDELWTNLLGGGLRERGIAHNWPQTGGQTPVGAAGAGEHPFVPAGDQIELTCDDNRRDVRHVVASVPRSPASAAMTLAVGIGADPCEFAMRSASWSSASPRASFEYSVQVLPV